MHNQQETQMSLHSSASTLSLKSTIIFDLDGTLVDSVPDLAASINDMLMSLERETFSIDTIRTWVGNGAKTLVERALSGQQTISNDLDPQYCAQALAIFLEHYHRQACVNTYLYDGVKSSLQTLRDRGYTLHIVTNKPLEFVAPILKKLAIDSYFSMILGADSLAKKKPDPLPLIHIFQQQSIGVENCVMIGDSHNDILAANAAKMQSIALTYGYNYGEDITKHHPTIVCDAFSDILNYFPQLSK